MRGKFDRNYRLDIITPAGKQITIERPISINFQVTRNTLSSANRVNITLYNLNENTRNQIYKDRYSITEYWRVRLWAGYGNRLSEIFTGNLYEGFSNKTGTEWITSLDCFDGMDAIQNGYTSQTIQAGTPRENILNSVINDMPNMVAGIFGTPADGQAPRGKVLLGPSVDIISQETGGQYFIDGETLNVLSDDEVISGPVVVLGADQLLQSPQRRDTFLDNQTLFEPQVQIGRVYEINSLQAKFNGQYKIVGFQHDVTISEAMAGKAVTTLSLYYGAAGLQEVG